MYHNFFVVAYIPFALRDAFKSATPSSTWYFYYWNTRINNSKYNYSRLLWAPLQKVCRCSPIYGPCQIAYLSISFSRTLIVAKYSFSLCSASFAWTSSSAKKTSWRFMTFCFLDHTKHYQFLHHQHFVYQHFLKDFL